MIDNQESKYRWYILALAALTHLFVVGIQTMCMPVLFSEIAADLGLSLVQLGTIWGMIALSGALTGLLGGLISDRYGTKRTLGVACLLAGVTGALRGLSGSFMGLSATVFVFGFMLMAISLNAHKTASVWFRGQQVVIANGIISTGIALGFVVGAMVSDTIMSPLLGGWQNVFFLYGTISMVFGLLWFATKREPVQAGAMSFTGTIPLRQALSRAVHLKNVWLLAASQLCYIGCIHGLIGYLPLYLRGIGWTAASADGTLAAFNLAGMLAAIPLTLVAARFGSRKTILTASLIVTLISAGLLSIVDGNVIWFLAILIGLFRDGYIAILVTMTTELRGIGAIYAGTAVGLVFRESGQSMQVPRSDWSFPSLTSAGSSLPRWATAWPVLTPAYPLLSGQPLPL